MTGLMCFYLNWHHLTIAKRDWAHPCLTGLAWILGYANVIINDNWIIFDVQARSLSRLGYIDATSWGACLPTAPVVPNFKKKSEYCTTLFLYVHTCSLISYFPDIGGFHNLHFQSFQSRPVGCLPGKLPHQPITDSRYTISVYSFPLVLLHCRIWCRWTKFAKDSIL